MILMPRISVVRLVVAGLIAACLFLSWTNTRKTVDHIVPVIYHDLNFSGFNESLLQALDGHPPGIDPVQKTGIAPTLVFWRADAETRRPDLINLTSSDVDLMRISHDSYKDNITGLAIPFATGASGIVSSAGGKYLSVFAISLRMLRRTGCTTPVELFVDTEEELQSSLCKTILPNLDARCIRLVDRLGQWTEKLSNYQVKAFAMIASSFQNVLFLDADAFMAKDPSHLFVSERFKAEGLLTWPDFWASSASRYFYDILGLDVPAMNSHPSTESGQLLISKSSHGKALLMAAYYNYHGPSHYYPLTGQGGPGEGDKDTFIAAAQVLSLSYYRVNKCVDTIGYYEGEKYHGGAMLQYDPTQDTEHMYIQAGEEIPDPFSVHHNIPKYDPVQLFALGVVMNSETQEYHRLLGTKELTLQRFGRDIESELWEEIQYVACGLGDKIPAWKVMETEREELGTCDRVKQYRALVFGSST